MLLLQLNFAKKKDTAHLAETCLENDPAPVIVTDSAGDVIFANASAEDRWPITPGQDVSLAFKCVLANPSDTVARLMAQADEQGAANEAVFGEIKSKQLHVHSASGGRFVWRLQEHVPMDARGCIETFPVLYLSESGTIKETNT